MDKKKINILLVEDDKADAALIRKVLKGARKARFNVEVRDTLVSGLERLEKGGIGLVLLDLTLPDSVGLDTFGRMHAHAPKVPIIVMTSSADEEQTAAAFQKGAQDYLVKGQINTDTLSRSIRYGIERNRAKAQLLEAEKERAHAEEGLRESEELFRIIFESTTDCIIVWDKDYNYIYANQAAIDHVGATRDKVIGKNIRDGLGHIPEFMKLWMERVDKVFRTQKPMRVEDSMAMGDRIVHSESILSPIRDKSGDVFAVGVVYRDVTDRKYAENKIYKINRELTTSAKKLNKLALRDPQTGLYNHSYMEKIIEAEFYRAKRYNHALAIIMMDIDYFKSINEVYGYKFGDIMLKQLAPLGAGKVQQRTYGHLHLGRFARIRDQDIVRLHVTVDDSARVGFLQALGHREADFHGRRFR